MKTKEERLRSMKAVADKAVDMNLAVKKNGVYIWIHNPEAVKQLNKISVKV